MSGVVTVAPKSLIGLHAVGPSSFNDNEGSGASFADRVWRELIDIVARSGAPLNVEMYGVSWPADDLIPPQQVHYFCGLESSLPLSGLSPLVMEGGTYFEFIYEGARDRVDHGFQEAYVVAMPASGLQARDGQHLEIYGDEYDPNSSLIRFRILIPVQSPTSDRN